jgi:hypothetical protein
LVVKKAAKEKENEELYMLVLVAAVSSTRTRQISAHF